MNAFDRLRISLARKIGGGAANVYESGQTTSRKRQRIPGGMPQDTRKELPAMTRRQGLKRSRHLGQNSGFLQEGASLFQTYGIGEGMRPQAGTDREDWNEMAEQIFADWAGRPEITGQYTFPEVQHMVCRAIDGDGEIFALKIRDRFNIPRLQILETHRFSTTTDAKKRIYDGIRYGSLGRPLAYHLMTPDQFGNLTKERPIKASGVIHVFEPSTISASRHLPPGQHGLLNIQDAMETTGFMTQKVKDHAEKSLLLKSNRETALQDMDAEYDSEDLAVQPTDIQEISEALGGRNIRVNTDEDLSVLESQEPHASFFDHIEQLERDAAGGGLDYAFLRNSKGVGGATARMIVSKVARRIAYRQNVMNVRFNNPAWFYVIGDAINNGELEAIPRWHKPRRWTSTKSITVDAGREAQANREDVILGPKLISEDVSERGGDFGEWLQKRTNEARKIMTAAGYAETDPIPLEMIYNPGGSLANSNLISENAR